MSLLTIYYHKDFDGFVAAALLTRINEETQFIGAENIDLRAVDYDIKEKWLKTDLNVPNVVIDFLYHPKADWWFDHHVSTFLNAKHKSKYQNSRKQLWNVNYPSCAALIKQNLNSQCSLFINNDEYENIVNGFREWIQWSNIIDNATYDSPAQVVELKEPCLQINATLSHDIEDSYLHQLVTLAKKYSPQEVAQSAMVKEKIDIVLAKQKEYMQSFKNEYKLLLPDIVFFDYVKNGIPFQRYLTYYYKPDANYSIGLYGRAGKFAISVGKNPWVDFPSKNIGDICKTYGGGGRVNVGSIILTDYSKALKIVDTIANLLSN